MTARDQNVVEMLNALTGWARWANSRELAEPALRDYFVNVARGRPP